MTILPWKSSDNDMTHFLKKNSTNPILQYSSQRDPEIQKNCLYFRILQKNSIVI